MSDKPITDTSDEEEFVAHACCGEHQPGVACSGARCCPSCKVSEPTLGARVTRAVPEGQ